MDEKVLTFLISSPDNASFTPDLYSYCRNFVNDANIVVLHEFNHFYNCIFKYANDDFTFRIFIHSGSADKGTVMTSGDAIYQEIRGKTEFSNIEISFITRKPDWFDKNQYSTLREGIKYWNMKYFNSDAAIKTFLDETKPIRKGDLKTVGTSNNHTKPISKPKIFIGSSSSKEALDTAMAIKTNLSKIATCDIWNENVFKIGETTLDTLERIIHEYDYSIFVFRGDDTLFERNGKTVPRDNVILEYGMFLGTQTRKKTFFVVPKDKDIHIATDLLGLTYPIPYDLVELERNPVSALSVPCSQIKEAIQKK